MRDLESENEDKAVILKHQQSILERVAFRNETEIKFETAIQDIKIKFQDEINQIRAWVSEQLFLRIGEHSNLNERFLNKADTSDITRLRRKIGEINIALEKGLDSILVSCKNEVKLAVNASASQDDFTFLKETKVDKTLFEELRAKIQDMENKVSEFKENNDISFSEDKDSEENMDDVMEIGGADELLEEIQPTPTDGLMIRNKSLANNEIIQPDIENKAVVPAKIEESKDGSSTMLIRKDTNKSIADIKSSRSGESPSNVKRTNADKQYVDPHTQSRYSTQSHRTASKIASSKNLNQYGFGNSFYIKYQKELKSNKKNPKLLIKYLQVQVNDIGSKIMEILQMNDLIKSDVYNTKDKLLECIQQTEKIEHQFTDIRTNYSHIDDDYQHIIKYYDFSKKQHEEVLQYLYNTEKALKDNEKEIKNFIESQRREIEDKRKRIITLEANMRQTGLDIKFIKEQKHKLIEDLNYEIQSIQRKDHERDEKLDDVIREISNVDFKHGAQSEIISCEILKIKEPIQHQITNMQRENDALLRELGRTQKDYRTMLSEFINAVNTDCNDSNLKSQVLNKTGEVVLSHDSFNIPNKRECCEKINRPATTTNIQSSKQSLFLNSIPYSLRSSPKLALLNETAKQSPQLNDASYELKKPDQIVIQYHSRASTHHGTRFNSYNKKLEIREQNLKQIAPVGIPNKKKRIMTSKPRANYHSRDNKYKNPSSNKSDMNIISQENVTTLSGIGIQSSTTKFENPPAHVDNSVKYFQSKISNQNKSKDPRLMITNIHTPNSEFGISANVDINESKRSNPGRGMVLHRFEHLFKNDSKESNNKLSNVNAKLNHSSDEDAMLSMSQGRGNRAENRSNSSQQKNDHRSQSSQMNRVGMPKKNRKLVFQH